MSQSAPAQAVVSPSPVDQNFNLTPAEASESELLDQKFKFFADALEAASNADDSLPEEEKVALVATRLKLKHDAYLLALTSLEALEYTRVLEGLERLAISFGELDLRDQVSFIRTMNTDLRKRFEETRKKIDNMELDPEPLTDLLKYVANAAKLFGVCVGVFEGMADTMLEYYQEKKKLLHERQNRVLMPCGSSSRRPSATDYDFAMRKFVLMQRTWSKLQSFKMELDPGEGMRLLSLGDE